MDNFDRILNEIPATKLPTQIIEAVENDKLAVFIGAGVSRIIGCKGWDSLAYELLKKCYKSKDYNGRRFINYKDMEVLSSYPDQKKLITICFNIFKDKNRMDLFYEVFNKALEYDKDEKNKYDIYREITEGLKGLYITTNADRHMHKHLVSYNIKYKVEDFNKEFISLYNLYHIHGMQDKNDTLVFTVPQYIKRYQIPHFREFLEEIFINYTVLFIGYGMAEFELLDFLITKSIDSKDIRNKHFILFPLYKYDTTIYKVEQEYFNSMGINIIPYFKDENGYQELYFVLKKWKEQILKTSAITENAFRKLDKLMEVL